MTSPSSWLAGAAFAVALRLRIDGKPMPAPRPRFSKWGAYSPKTYTDWQADALAQLGVHTPISGPLCVALDVVGERPKKTILCAPRGDCDNFAKSVLDVLTKARVWLDDTQVGTLLIRKRWSDSTDPPGTTIWIASATP